MRKPRRGTDAAKPPAKLMQIALERLSRSARGRRYAHTRRATGRYPALDQGFAPRAPSRQLPRELKRASLNLPTTVVQPEEWLALSIAQAPPSLSG